MVTVLVAVQSNRLAYTLDLIFSRILGIPYKMIPVKEYQPGDQTPVINYTQLILPGTFSIPNNGLLKGQEIEPVDIRLVSKDIPYLFYFSVSGSSYQINFDLFSAIFYLVSEYEKYLRFYPDHYGRYNETSYDSAQFQLDQVPLVHRYCQLFWGKLSDFYSHLSIPSPEKSAFDYQFTFDIDFPWKYLHKGMAVNLGGIGKDLSQGAWKRASERIRSLALQDDPNDTYELIFSVCPPEKTAFFFLIDRNSEYDSRFTYKNPQFRSLITTIQEKGYTVGIHPSYSSFLDGDRMVGESTRISGITGEPVTHSRQHFLRYRIPDTFRFLLAAGIRHDYSLCRIHTGGFPCGMAVPFPWFDLEEDCETELMLHPTMVMDRSLQQYQGMSPQKAVTRIRELISVTKEVNGIFTLLLHNDALSESEEWEGWRMPLLEVLKELSGRVNND